MKDGCFTILCWFLIILFLHGKYLSTLLKNLLHLAYVLQRCHLSTSKVALNFTLAAYQHYRKIKTKQTETLYTVASAFVFYVAMRSFIFYSVQTVCGGVEGPVLDWWWSAVLSCSAMFDSSCPHGL